MWCRPTTSRFARLVIAEAMVEAMEDLDLQFPKVEDAALKELKKVRARSAGRGRRNAK